MEFSSVLFRLKNPKQAWQGSGKKNNDNLIITSLPDNKRRIELTFQQKRTLEGWLAQVTPSAIDTSVREQAVNELRRQLILTENEGLAEKLAAITKARQADGLPLLMARSGSLRDGQVGIDGPYHKIMVDYILDSFETAAGK